MTIYLIWITVAGNDLVAGIFLTFEVFKLFSFHLARLVTIMENHHMTPGRLINEVNQHINAVVDHQCSLESLRSAINNDFFHSYENSNKCVNTISKRQLEQAH